MAQRTLKQEAAQEEARRDSLHTLYMHARSFITTEEQLNAKIEELFVSHPFAGPDGRPTESIWDEGAPPTVQDMLRPLNNTERTALDYHAGPAGITGKRMVRIAEELTGGKMEYQQDKKKENDDPWL